jgi:hypothetical protein
MEESKTSLLTFDKLKEDLQKHLTDLLDISLFDEITQNLMVYKNDKNFFFLNPRQSIDHQISGIPD